MVVIITIDQENINTIPTVSNSRHGTLGGGVGKKVTLVIAPENDT